MKCRDDYNATTRRHLDKEHRRSYLEDSRVRLKGCEACRAAQDLTRSALGFTGGFVQAGSAQNLKEPRSGLNTLCIERIGLNSLWHLIGE